MFVDVNLDDLEFVVMMRLKSNEYTRAMWDEAFEATYEVILRWEKLKMELCVKNMNEEMSGKVIDFIVVIYMYIEVMDCVNAGVFARGLSGKTYLDKNVDANDLLKKV